MKTESVLRINPGVQPQVVGFGMLTPVAILVVDQLPEHNTGALIREISEFIFDDAAIVSCLLRQWGIETGMIGTTLGDDIRGHTLASELELRGVRSEIRFSGGLKTPLEVDVSDKLGARTYFWQREEKVLATLETADLSMIQGSNIVYVDWYDGDPILRAMDEAIVAKVPVFLNFEFGHSQEELVKKYAGRATICQAVTDAAQKESTDPMQVAEKLLQAGVQQVIITLASEGSLVVSKDEGYRVYAPPVNAVDGCGAGATYSSGFIYGILKNWSMEKCARYATAAASLKVTRAGLEMFPEKEILELAEKIRVEKIR